MEGGREGGREREREGGSEQGRRQGREREREGGREREGRREREENDLRLPATCTPYITMYYTTVLLCTLYSISLKGMMSCITAKFRKVTKTSIGRAKSCST